jgi:hypothetical protein
VPLTDEQAKQLEELEKLRDAPDEPAGNGGGIGRVLNVTIDLGDDKQVARAFKLGLLDEPAPDEPEGGEGEGEEQTEGEGEGPRRGGFFND